MRTTKPDGRASRQIARARDVLDRVLAFTETGPADHPIRLRRVDLAASRADDRRGGQVPRFGIRGGSTNPEGREERDEQARTIAQAGRDADDLRKFCKEIERLSDLLERIVVRQVEVIHDGKRPIDTLPGCKSCARKDKDGRGGHFATVWEKRPSPGLCFRCYEFRGRFGDIPPIMWCHVLHTESRDRADRWLKRNDPILWAKAIELVPTDEKTCGHPVWTGAGEEPCARPAGHDGTCTAATTTVSA